MVSRKIRIHNFLENKALRDDAVKIYRQVESGQDSRKNLPPPAWDEGLSTAHRLV